MAYTAPTRPSQIAVSRRSNPGREIPDPDRAVSNLKIAVNGDVVEVVNAEWEQLEVLYKCVLVSLVLHLLMMWWFRDVYPEGGTYELQGDSDRIRIRVLSRN